MVAQQQTLRDRQVGRPAYRSLCENDCTNRLAASLEKILNLNHLTSANETAHHDHATANGLVPQSTPILNSDGDPIWKILVFDDLGRDVISSVLRVNDLRGWGVTIHLWVALKKNRR